ncbi:hypothetical protein [Euzebya sp.]|uniref:hypothetical protein n=1 Tax=Euzebya sp. TaxID=1971409 RepID=UPI003519817B
MTSTITPDSLGTAASRRPTRDELAQQIFEQVRDATGDARHERLVDLIGDALPAGYLPDADDDRFIRWSAHGDFDAVAGLIRLLQLPSVYRRVRCCDDPTPEATWGLGTFHTAYITVWCTRCHADLLSLAPPQGCGHAVPPVQVDHDRWLARLVGMLELSLRHLDDDPELTDTHRKVAAEMVREALGDYSTLRAQEAAVAAIAAAPCVICTEAAA